MGRKRKDEQGQQEQQGEQAQAQGTQEGALEKAPAEGGADEVQERLEQARERGFFGETNDPYDQDEYAAPPGGNEGRTAHEERAKAVNPEGHGRAVPGHHQRTF